MNSGHHKTIFSKRLGCLVAVGEHASNQGKANGAASGQFSGSAGIDWLSTVLQFVGVLSASCALVTLAWAGPVASTALPNSLPTGGQVAQGAASISQSGAVMNITQSTPKAVLNWNTFDIGQNAKVNIVQPGADAVMLNRVTSANPSQILGQLNANGQVVLVNPNGVLFGKDGSVNASSFTASTLGITDANFMAGNQQFERNGSTAAVVNQGSIKTTGGYVALLGASVSNEGQINTQGGTAYMAAAETVKIPVSGSGRIKLELSPSRINAAVANGKTGTIVTEGGQVYMQAASLSSMVASIIQSGNIDSTGEQGGAVHLLADGGRIKVDGSITANSTNVQNKGGDIVIGRDEETGVLAKATDVSGAKLKSGRGFIETSGDHLATDGVNIQAAEWLLDPSDVTIVGADGGYAVSGAAPGITYEPNTGVASSTVSAETIKSAIDGGTSVTITTTNSGTSGAGAGNITITSGLAFNNTGAQDATLTLIADNGITQNAAITATGSKLVNISMTANGNYQGSNTANSNSKGITLNNTININGDVTLKATINNPSTNTEAIRFNNTSITAQKYDITGTNNNTANSSHGVVLNGTNTFTGTQDSSIRGVSKGGPWPPSMGLYYLSGSNTTINSGEGHAKVVGVLTGSGNNGSRTGFIGGANITTNSSGSGSVTLGSNEVGASFFHRAGEIKAATGTLNILGSYIETYDSTAKIKGANGTTISLSAPSVQFRAGASHIAPLTSGGAFTLNVATDNFVVINSSTTSSGTGTTTIKNFTPGTKINLGGSDAAAAGSSPATLGLSSAEIASFTAGNLHFGSDTSGDLVVSNAISLSKIRITSNENIDINATLTATTTQESDLPDAIVIIAGKDKVAGDKDGGNIKIAAGIAINVQTGGTAQLFSGSIAGTTGISALAPSGSGKFRYNSDETYSNYTKNLDKKSEANNGINMIYREAPDITVTAKSTPTGQLTYNGNIRLDPNAGYTSDVASAGKNGDLLTLNETAISYGYAKGSGATLETYLKNAGTYTKTVTGLTNNLGYKVTTVNGSVEIDRAALTVTAQQVTKTYDGTINAIGTGSVGALADEGEIVDSFGTQAFTDKNFGVGNKIVRASGVTIKDSRGVDVTSNYNITYVDNTTSTINKLAISAAIDAVTTTYGTNAATGGVSLIGVINGDSVSPSGSSLEGSVLSTSGRIKAGTYVQSVGGSLSGTDAGNYTFSGTSSANYVVNRLALNTQIAGVTTIYGTAAATGATSVSGVLSGDKVDLGNVKATLVDAINSSSGQLRVGTYKQTVASGLSGDDAGNYTALPTSVANYVVTPRAIAATVSVADKVYDGSDVATWTTKFSDILAGDVVKVEGAKGTFASKNVASDGSGNAVAQTVTVAGPGVSLGSTDGANYTLSNAANIATTTAKIIPKDLTVTGITANDKVYDGSTSATLNTANAVISGLVAGDSVNVSTQSAVGNFASKDVAFDAAGAVASQAVAVNGLSLNGASAVNYIVSDKSGATAKVLQRALSITGSVAQDKTVDGNTNAQVRPGQLGNLVAGESLVVSATGQFADAEIGTNKAVTTQYALANGANGVARNYTLAGEVLRAAILVASINPVQPIVNPSRTPGGGRVVVSGSGNSGAALGVAEGSAEEEVISREECSVLTPEKCECQESTIAGVEMCFAPTLAANSKN